MAEEAVGNAIVPVPPDPAAVVPAVPASPAAIDLASITKEEDAKWNKLKWVWRMDCEGGSISKSGWSHKSRLRHDCISLKEAGKVDEAMMEFLFTIRGGAAAAKALVQQKQQAEAGQGRELLPSAPPEPVFEFGSHRGRKLKDMLTSEVSKDWEYIPWLFASSSAQARGKYLDALESALRMEGLWEQTQEMATKMRPVLMSRHLEKTEKRGGCKTSSRRGGAQGSRQDADLASREGFGIERRRHGIAYPRKQCPSGFCEGQEAQTRT
jgi:hypothetical protein